MRYVAQEPEAIVGDERAVVKPDMSHAEQMPKAIISDKRAVGEADGFDAR